MTEPAIVDIPRELIVNADDFGQTRGITRGIIEAHENGIVTSASLVVRWDDTGRAADYAKSHADLDVGLHVDLGEWRCEGGNWIPAYTVVPLTEADAVRAEAHRQLDTFLRLVGREPTHLDSHQHVHRKEPARAVLADMADALGVPLRHEGPVTYCGEFYGQAHDGGSHPEALTVEALVRIIASLPEGVTELACHPGYASDFAETMYRHEREIEVATLCDPRVRDSLAAHQVVLRTFADLSPA